jgi:hypothetical protein
MINTIKNSKLIQHVITLLTEPSSVSFIIDVEFVNTNNIFVGKTLTIKTDLNKTLVGIVGRSATNWFITLPTETLIGDEYTAGTNSFYFESFTTELDEDNALVTFSDIQKSLQSSESKFTNGALISYGKDGLLTGSEKYAINNLIDHEISLVNKKTINNISIIPTLLCNVDVKKDKLFNHTIIIGGNDLQIKLNIQLNNYGLLKPSEFSLRVLDFSSSELLKNVAIDFTIENNMNVSTKQNYLSIYAKFDNSQVLIEPTTKNYNVTHVNGKKTIFYDVPPVLPSKNKLNYNLKVLYQNLYSDVFKLNENISGYTQNGIEYKKPTKIAISEFSNIDSYVSEGEFYMHNGDISTIVNKPVNTNQRFDLLVRNMNLGSSLEEYYVVQTFTTYEQIVNTPNYKLSSFVRVSSTNINGIIWSDWLSNSLGGHTHQATDIEEDELHNFVTETNITNWDGIRDYIISDIFTWKKSVILISDLATTFLTPKIGWSCFVNETKSVWKYDGTEWLDNESIVSSNKKGLISTSQFKEFFTDNSQSKYVSEKTNSFNYIHRGTLNPKTIYGENYQFLLQDNIDLVRRTAPLTEAFGSFSYQQGFDILADGGDNYIIGRNILTNKFDKSIGIGIGLRYNTEDQTIFGSFNTIANSDGFVIGNGVSEDFRSNLFSIAKNGIAKLNGGYSVSGKTDDDILVADGTTIKKSALSSDKRKIVWNATIVPLPLQNFVLLPLDNEIVSLNVNTMIFVNGILLDETQYTITDTDKFTILDVLDNQDIIIIK